MGPVLVTSDLQDVDHKTAIALGNFDGLHLGHQAVIGALAQAPSHLQRALVTFTPHPQAFFQGITRPLLTPLAEKVPILAGLGIEQLIRIPFTHALAQLSPEAFVQSILVNQLQTEFIAVGFNFGFGAKRAGTAADLQNLAWEFGIPVVIVEPQRFGPDRISSSAIRQALGEGHISLAQKLLGRPYRLQGTVIQGQQLGRSLGFPTANLALEPEKFLPRQGVYVVTVQGDGWEQPWPGVLNLGNRPTVSGEHLTAEVHLLDWAGDLYGQVLRTDCYHFLRPELKFASLTELRQQISQDCHQARHWLETNLTPTKQTV
ncbi:bifunctional riboflavin kinase/FAD synthetase [Thermosynechococcaceae cyanobacterium BACA0444]|uniref:Riboflavin biosynthesis protein n=1 Tax=Pseudocalidococcus azoricus BACA0444 TaxID=2918990 RepID=A0AAE4FPG6_9CYAN|nr:bifunctional riboflavin kinase/FAD synthetase [Pseudocalidococcus azoricus]MDS3859834.1 bifunctional riboflavin kinase/FAD synthetase [Pseudocalidococcus azoricus BACA0444]